MRAEPSWTDDLRAIFVEASGDLEQAQRELALASDLFGAGSFLLDKVQTLDRVTDCVSEAIDLIEDTYDKRG
jgi:hypothetical protein